MQPPEVVGGDRDVGDRVECILKAIVRLRRIESSSSRAERPQLAFVFRRAELPVFPCSFQRLSEGVIDEWSDLPSHLRHFIRRHLNMIFLCPPDRKIAERRKPGRRRDLLFKPLANLLFGMRRILGCSGKFH